MTEQEFMMMMMYATAMASRSESVVVLKEKHLKMQRLPPAKRKKPLPPKNVRRWRGLFEHRDTPIHHN
jgi:hypothetical protein